VASIRHEDAGAGLLVLIGVALVADGLGFHIPRGYIYFAIAFSAAVELFNVMAKRNRWLRAIAGRPEVNGAAPVELTRAAPMALVSLRPSCHCP